MYTTAGYTTLLFCTVSSALMCSSALVSACISTGASGADSGSIARKTSQPPFIAHHPSAVVHGAGDDILHNGVYHFRDAAYALILHLRQTLVQLAQIGLQGAHHIVGVE